VKIALNIVGGAAILVGVLWILQGQNVAPGIVPVSFMTGRVTWTGNGAFLIVFAAALLVWANRARPPKT
jgi:hypothetical protein